MHPLLQRLLGTRTATPPSAAPVTTAVPGGHLPILPADAYEEVDVAIVAESTYPYLRGGVSAVIQDILVGNPDLTFGIIHIAWDGGSASEDLYEVPENVRWIRPVFLSMAEHREDFSRLPVSALGMTARQRERLAERLFDALDAVLAGDMEPLWSLYDDGMNPRTRSFPLWALLGSKELMGAARRRLPGLGLPLTDTFWLLREFFSLACAVVGGDLPAARVYHSHTTGYASLLAAAAARQNGGRFLLTEHNLYVRDTINLLLDRSMALPITARDWYDFEDVTPVQRAWMAWWIEMGRFTYPSTAAITYLYPSATLESADLGSPIEKSVVIPNGMVLAEFDEAYRLRQEAVARIVEEGDDHVWRLVYIARLVPIKGLLDLIDTVALLVGSGMTNFHLDILGPSDERPDYEQMCRDKAAALGVDAFMTFRGSVRVRDELHEYDVLVLPSHNEGQPMVVLEAMSAGIPTVGTTVGGMEQLVADRLTKDDITVGPCGLLVPPQDSPAFAARVQELVGSTATYAEYAANARARVVGFFQLHEAMGAYNLLYKELAGLVPEVREPAAAQRVTVLDLDAVAGLDAGVDESPSR